MQYSCATAKRTVSPPVELTRLRVCRLLLRNGSETFRRKTRRRSAQLRKTVWCCTRPDQNSAHRYHSLTQARDSWQTISQRLFALLYMELMMVPIRAQYLSCRVGLTWAARASCHSVVIYASFS